MKWAVVCLRMSSEVLSKEEVLNLISVDIVHYEFENVEGHPGFLGEYFKIKMVQSNHKVHHFFVKALPFSDKDHRKIVQNLGMFKKETEIYRNIFAAFKKSSDLSKWRPQCFYARDDILVLEDLTYKGYAHVPLRTELKQAHVEEALKSLARLHATSLNYELNEIKDQRLDEVFPEVLFEPTVHHGNGWFLAGLSAIKVVALNSVKYGRYRKLIGSKLSYEMNKVFDLVKSQTRFKNTLIHRDLWVNNMMFKFDKNIKGQLDYDKPLNCCLIDFQICRYLPPAVDVLDLLYLITRRQHRDTYFKHYKNFYYEKLSCELKSFNIPIENVIPIEDFFLSLEYYKLLALVFNGIYSGIVHSLPEGALEHLKAQCPAEYDKICNINRDKFTLELMEKDEYFSVAMNEAVEELLEYCFEF